MEKSWSLSVILHHLPFSLSVPMLEALRITQFDWEVNYLLIIQRSKDLERPHSLFKKSWYRETADSNPDPFHTKTCVFSPLCFSYVRLCQLGIAFGVYLLLTP